MAGPRWGRPGGLGRLAEARPGRVRSQPAAGGAACARVVNIVEQLRGLPNNAIVRKVTRFARILSFLLFATKDPCLGFLGDIKKERAIERENTRNTLGVCPGSGN